MTAEPPPLPASVFAPGKETEIAAPTDALTETIHYLFTVLPPEMQGDVLVQLAEYMKAKNAEHYSQIVQKFPIASAVHPLVPSFGALKSDPIWEEYEAALRELKEEDRKRAQAMYPERDSEAV